MGVKTRLCAACCCCQVPGEAVRSYHSHRVGPAVTVVSLDTAHSTPYAGAQTEWLNVQLQGATTNAPSQHRVFAQYHIPIYPQARTHARTHAREHARARHGVTQPLDALLSFSSWPK